MVYSKQKLVQKNYQNKIVSIVAANISGTDPDFRTFPHQNTGLQVPFFGSYILQNVQHNHIVGTL
jgi:hypothetical protein